MSEVSVEKWSKKPPGLETMGSEVKISKLTELG